MLRTFEHKVFVISCKKKIITIKIHNFVEQKLEILSFMWWIVRFFRDRSFFLVNNQFTEKIVIKKSKLLYLLYIIDQWRQLSAFHARFSPFWRNFNGEKCLALFARFSFNSVWQYCLMFLCQCRIITQCGSTFFFYFLFVFYIEVTKLPRNTSYA